MVYAKIIYAVAVLFVICNGNAKAQEPCPFNPTQCECVKGREIPPEEPLFYFATCDASSGFPVLTAPPNVTYTIINIFTIEGKVDQIPANAFAVINNMYKLNLQHTASADFPAQKWDKDAFQGTSIRYLYISGLSHIFPLPNLRSDYFSELMIDNGGAIQVPKNILDNNYTVFFTLHIVNTKITQIDDDAFALLKKSLVNLQFTNAALTSVATVTKAISMLSLEIKADLSDNPFVEIDLSALPASTTLWTFDGEKQLKNLIVSDVSKARHDTYYSFKETSLETIDSKLDQVLSQNPNTVINFYNCVNLKCTGLEWMKKYDVYPYQVEIMFVRCADKGGMLLEDYLKSV